MYAACREDNPGWEPPASDGEMREAGITMAGVLLDHAVASEERMRQSYGFRPWIIGLAAYPPTIKAAVDQAFHRCDVNTRARLQEIVADEFWSRIRAVAESVSADREVH